MAVRGASPRDSAMKRNKRPSETSDWVDVPDVPFSGVRPELPETRTVVTRDGQETVTMLAITRQWWDTVTSMPHCVLWSESDWMFALSTAIVADAAFCGISSAMGELRLREKDMGTTAEYRRANRIRYVDAVEEPAVPAGVANLDHYRDL